MSRMINQVLALAAGFALFLGVAHADPVNLGKLTLNGVAPGDTVAHVQQALGKPAAVKGSKKQFLLYNKGAWNRLTLELGTDGKHVAFIQNGSALSLSGKKILKIGDPTSLIDVALGKTPHSVREKVDSFEWVYKQTRTMLIVVVKDNHVADLILGNKDEP